MKKLLLTIVLALFSTNLSAQDFNKGYEAYKAGDYATALKEWKPLAEQGYAAVQYNLGWMYHKGNGVVQNYAEALKYNGNGVLKDFSQAVKWYQLSAEQGHLPAQNNLGAMYRDGKGVLKDYTEAVKWFRLTAEQGDATAQANLGILYGASHTVLYNNLTSHMWYNIASANGHEKAGEYRDERAGLMTPDAIKKATAMARECMASNYKKCGY